MEYDATFFAFVGLIIFLGIIAYLKVPGMMAKSLDARAENIREELAEAKRLREEAQQLLVDYQKKSKEAEAEAAGILAAAQREAAAMSADAKLKTDEFVARRNAISEQKIKQAEVDAINAVRAAAVDLATAAAETVMAKQSDAELQARLFQSGVGEVKSRLN
jgi:F-type H+-transporting ATPase subunit b